MLPDAPAPSSYWSQDDPRTCKKVINAHSNTLNKMLYRYLTAPATSTAVERLFSAAGLILDAKRSKLDPAWVDHILFLREAFLLGTCKLEWE